MSGKNSRSTRRASSWLGGRVRCQRVTTTIMGVLLVGGAADRSYAGPGDAAASRLAERGARGQAQPTAAILSRQAVGRPSAPGDGPVAGRLAIMPGHGARARWEGGGLQNRYERVRFPWAPPGSVTLSSSASWSPAVLIPPPSH